MTSLERRIGLMECDRYDEVILKKRRHEEGKNSFEVAMETN